MLLTADQILQADDSPTEIVSVPEWGGEVKVRTLNGRERDVFEASVNDGKQTNFANIRARLVSLSVCDEKGDRIFSDAQVDILGKRSAKALDRVFAVAQRLSGLTKEDVEQLVKNSATGPNACSTSA